MAGMTEDVARTVPDLTSWSDRRLENWIQRGHSTASKHSAGYEEAAAVTGLLLIERKRRLPHGAWTPWLEENFEGSYETARRYMEVVKTHADVCFEALERALVQTKTTTRLEGLTGEIEWYTPREYLDAAIEVMGEIELDPASSDTAQEHVNAVCYFTLQDDGLTRDWSGRVFLNPPYAMPQVRDFTAKLAAAYRRGEVPEAILLVNNATDTEWFHAALSSCSALCLMRGRIKFLKAQDGELVGMGSPTHGQIFLYFGESHEAFTKTFRRYGAILKPTKEHEE